MADNMSEAQRSYTMSRIRSEDTKVELMLRRALFSRGLRYRLHRRELPGRPDIVFPREKVAVFVDGDFWHGWNYEDWTDNLKPYWRDKIARNIRRDGLVTEQLRGRGWKVLRIWEHEIEADVASCADQVERALGR